jgi:C4-dicarboxylate-specific signal transduction histidine kinase
MRRCVDPRRPSLAPLPSRRRDPVQLQQVVINLTLNALDAAAAVRTNRRVSVCTTSSHSAAEIAVHDNGPGLPLDSQQRLFEPFFTTKNQGLGMGLAIVRSIVERHHGRVHAEDGRGAGTVFRGGHCHRSPLRARETARLSFSRTRMRAAVR